MNDVNGMMKYSAVNRYGKYYSRKNRRERKSTKTPLGNLITNDDVNQQDGKENSVHALDSVKQPSPMVMFYANCRPIWRYVQWSLRSANQSDTALYKF
jgi:hypothetical protein